MQVFLSGVWQLSHTILCSETIGLARSAFSKGNDGVLFCHRKWELSEYSLFFFTYVGAQPCLVHQHCQTIIFGQSQKRSFPRETMKFHFVILNVGIVWVDACLVHTLLAFGRLFSLNTWWACLSFVARDNGKCTEPTFNRSERQCTLSLMHCLNRCLLDYACSGIENDFPEKIFLKFLFWGVCLKQRCVFVCVAFQYRACSISVRFVPEL